MTPLFSVGLFDHLPERPDELPDLELGRYRVMPELTEEQYGALKVETGEAVIAAVEPIRQRYEELMSDPGELSRLLRVGADKARNVAAATLDRAQRAIGMMPA